MIDKQLETMYYMPICSITLAFERINDNLASEQWIERPGNMKPKILLVNPPIYDFSAYDFWLKPAGLLRVAGFLR